MGIDDPGKNLKWLEQELLADDPIFRTAPAPQKVKYEEMDDRELMELVDTLIEEDEEEEEPPIRNFANNYGHGMKAQRAAHTQPAPKLEESAAVPVKTKKQLRREEKLRKKAEKKASVNRNIKGLVVLAGLECLGILVLLGWWLQWLI